MITKLIFPFQSWTFRRKWVVTAIVSCFTFVSPVSSSMMAPASETIAAQFHVTSPAITAMMTSMFVLGYGAFNTLSTYEIIGYPMRHDQRLVHYSSAHLVKYMVDPGYFSCLTCGMPVILVFSREIGQHR